MKKITLLSGILLILCCSLSYGQGMGYGFKFGANVSQINSFSFDVENSIGATAVDAPSSLEDVRFGFSATFFAFIKLNEKLSFQPEFTYSSQGNKFEELRYEYLQMPLGLNVDFDKFFIIAGPQVGLKISAFEQSENFKSIDFSAFGGVGYFITDNIFLEARYSIGFSEVFEDDATVSLPFPVNVGTSEEPTIISNTDNALTNLSGKNSYFNISIGYRL